MASYWLHSHDVHVSIPSIEESNTIIYYQIKVKIENVSWFVAHRYSEFYELHNALVGEHGVSRDALPAKKLFGSKMRKFVECRRQALEEYLQSMAIYLTRTMPQVFVEFLHLHLYDVFYLLQAMAAQYCARTSVISSQLFNPLELHAIGACLKFPHPNVGQGDDTKDLSHVFEVCSQLKQLRIEGKERYITSNICPNELPIEFTSFKNVEVLTAKNYNFDNISSLGGLRQTLKHFYVHLSNIASIAQILQCDNLHKLTLNPMETWTSLIKLDLSSNQISAIDDAIKLAPNIETLILNDNQISEINNLSTLSRLKHFWAMNNAIVHCDDLHTKIGNLLTLNLAQNRIERVKGLSKLYSLGSLILSSNCIGDIDDVASLGDLPCLENLTLTGNPVSTVIDYRIKVLQFFGERSKELCLDSEKPMQGEIDKALVLRALQIGREGRFVAKIS